MSKNSKKQILFTVGIAVGMIGIFTILHVSTYSLANLDPLLWINPESLIMPPNQPTDVYLQLDNITNVYGAQVSLVFDPAVIEVVDADPVTPGVQILPGNCPYPDFIVLNTADNGSGSIDYAVTQLYPRPSCNGGTLASITFQCLAPSGSSAVDFTETIISDPDGVPISHVTQGAEISCQESTTTPTPTITRTPSPTPTITNTPSPTWTETPSLTPSNTPTPTRTYTPTPTTTQEPLEEFYLPIIYRLQGS